LEFYLRLAVSTGDFNGIGIEAFAKSLKLLKDWDNLSKIQFIISVNSKLITEYLDCLDIAFEIGDNSIVIFGVKCTINEIQTSGDINFGKLSLQAGLQAAHSFQSSINLIKSNKADALLTLPINKEAMYMAGWKFPGHTESIAFEFGSKDQLMILFKNNVRVALATIHVPLQNVSKLLNKDLIIKNIGIFNDSLINDFGIENPRIAILGLNPHAGEQGNIGIEELEIIEPAINYLKKNSYIAFGPFAADGFFAHGDYKQYDGIFAMYHDQGLIPLKLLANGGGVNFTAGLPIVRTSPDHGTAFAIAGMNKANGLSTADAIISVFQIYENRNK